MNTLSPFAAAAALVRPSRFAARRLVVAAAMAMTLPLLTACSSDGSPTDSGAGTPGATADTAATTAPVSDAPTPTIGTDGDPFCDLAVGAQADALAAQEFTASFEPVISGIASGTAPIGDLNAWGTELGEHTQRALDFYDAAGPYVEGTDGEGPFTALETFTREYSLALATMAATATDSNAFLTEFADFVQTPELRDTILLGPAASTSVAEYITDRCPAVS